MPPFTVATAIQKVQMAEDAWNSYVPRKNCKWINAKKIGSTNNVGD
ncbi:MAG: DUF1348 family protein [Chitinophagaceae bacterium]|nr:DUF1348 family protein [Chitinophagaceae bacterium]